MDFKEYQQQASKTAIYHNINELLINYYKNIGCSGVAENLQLVLKGSKELKNPYYPAMGLSAEAGEISNKIKKVMRDKNGIISDELKDNIKGELGDVLWYISALATELDLNLNDIAEYNITKLNSRKQRNVLGGSGDNR